MSSPLLEVISVSKSFPGVKALKNVSLDLSKGEVLAVIGENGAGKSTLMKILAGVQGHDSGEIKLDGKRIRISSPRNAIDFGIVLIHQELNLVDNMDIAANIFLGREPSLLGWINKSSLRKRSEKFLGKVGLNEPATRIVSEMTIGKQQLVEIAKAVSVNARIIIMDEPTSSLSQRETDDLFRVVNDLKSRGVSIIYISHRLREVEELADRVVVLRDGENAGELTKDEIDHEAMVKLMVGRDVSQFYARSQHEIGETILEARNLVTPTWPNQKLSFSIKAGEIVGVSGLVGAGRTELLHVLFGIDQAVSGEILVGGKQVQIKSPTDAIQNGLALVPEDRKQHGLLLHMSVLENIGLPGLKTHQIAGMRNSARELADTETMTEKMRIRTPSHHQIVQYLSGGNQQKVVIGKWLSLGPRVLLLDEPTRGIDVGAKEEIYNLMERLAREGMAILFVSSEMEEILGMSDRALVMHEGRISGELLADELSEQAVMRLATGLIETTV